MGIILTQDQRKEVQWIIEKNSGFGVLSNGYPKELYYKMVIDSRTFDGFDNAGLEWLNGLSNQKLEPFDFNGVNMLMIVFYDEEHPCHLMFDFATWLQRAWRNKQTCEGAYI